MSIHYDCNEPGCKFYYAYIRFKRKWIKIGVFSSGCKQFEKLDDFKMPEDSKPKNSLFFPEDNHLKLLANKEDNYLKLLKNKEIDYLKLISKK